MSEKDDNEARARYAASGGAGPRPPPPKPESNWQSIIYRVIAAVVYFLIFWFFRFWNAHPVISIFLVLVGLWIFADGPKDASSFVTWVVIIMVVFGGAGWLVNYSPWKATIQNYYNGLLTPIVGLVNAASGLPGEFQTQLNCAANPGTCKTADIGTTQKTRKGLEITALSSESSVSVGTTARIFAALVNEGEADAVVKNARMYGGGAKNFRTASNIQCAGCAIGITNERITPNSRRDLSADISVPCERVSTYPFSLNMEYEYSVGASLPVDVINSKEYDAKTSAKEVFLTQPAADSSSGPVRAGISIGVEGYQPVKGGTKNILFAKLVNLGSGEFKLKSAKIYATFNRTELTDCKVNGAPVDINNLADPSGRYYPPEKFISLSCTADTLNPEGQKRFIATIDAKYLYNITRSSNIELDETGFGACNSTATTTSTTSTTTTTAAQPPPAP
ncbi:MAG: hypothetical protein HYS53_01555 [Candidatus Aenigmarchaeota archaeon]|nr:hypothetical protein [Candidatus Aenigmarchaeota archaeon]